MVILWILVTLTVGNEVSCQVFVGNIKTCGENEVLCGDGSKCISLYSVCDYKYDCEDRSDEELSFCKDKNSLVKECSPNYVKCTSSYYGNSCRDLATACGNEEYCISGSTSLAKLCKVKLLKKLDPNHESCPASNKSLEIMSYLASAFNESTSLTANDSCPPLYNKIGKQCISLFSPVEIGWSEAKVFCESISGKLLIVNSIGEHKKLLTYINTNEIQVNFWIGGFYGSTKKTSPSWVWLDGTNIEMGAPFWSIYNCITAKSSVKCQSTYLLMPTSDPDSKCVAMNHGYFYYFSNENCLSKRSPICVSN